jgi:hypothetical protein
MMMKEVQMMTVMTAAEMPMALGDRVLKKRIASLWVPWPAVAGTGL